MLEKVDMLGCDNCIDRYRSLEVRGRYSGEEVVAGSRSFDAEVHRKMNDMQKGRVIEARILRLVHPLQTERNFFENPSNIRVRKHKPI